MNKPLSILIVEDERLVAKDLQQTLVELGYDAFAIASSAEEAVQHASARCPEVVLMDIRIKGRLDGIEAAELLRRQFGVTLVYLTAHSDEATLERAKKTEPHGYLLKPVRAAELKSTIEVSHYRHKMEQRLRESEQRQSATLHSIRDAVITVDLSGRVSFMNQAAEELTGLKATEALGRLSSEILGLLGAPQEEPLQRALSASSAPRPEVSLQNHSTGASHLISDSAAPVVKDGELLGAVMVFRDVTEQKRLQKRLELSDRLTSLSTMASGVAHEVNNPLTAVLGNVDFALVELAQLRHELRGGSAPSAPRRLAELASVLSDIKNAGLRIGRIVSDLRAFSQHPETSAGVVELTACIQMALRSVEPWISSRTKLITQLGETPPVVLEEPRLVQVLAHLLKNAAQAIPLERDEQNEIKISTRTDSQGRAVIEISDSGVGIPPHLLSRIFDPFFTTKAVGEGTGLGLSVCHGIVSSFGGEITVESEAGLGSTFRVSLPPASQDSTSPAPAPSPSRAGHLLIIDDDPMLLSVFRRSLQEHTLSTTESAKEALALIQKGACFDAILTDLMMPTMTGRDFYERLLAEAPDLAKRVVFLTGGAISPSLEAFLRSTPNPVLEKPFSLEQLRAVIQRLVARAP